MDSKIVFFPSKFVEFKSKFILCVTNNKQISIPMRVKVWIQTIKLVFKLIFFYSKYFLTVVNINWENRKEKHWILLLENIYFQLFSCIWSEFKNFLNNPINNLLKFFNNLFSLSKILVLMAAFFLKTIETFIHIQN